MPVILIWIDDKNNSYPLWKNWKCKTKREKRWTGSYEVVKFLHSQNSNSKLNYSIRPRRSVTLNQSLHPQFSTPSLFISPLIPRLVIVLDRLEGKRKTVASKGNAESASRGEPVGVERGRQTRPRGWFKFAYRRRRYLFDVRRSPSGNAIVTALLTLRRRVLESGWAWIREKLWTRRLRELWMRNSRSFAVTG